jgi:hypothetical protein
MSDFVGRKVVFHYGYEGDPKESDLKEFLSQVDDDERIFFDIDENGGAVTIEAWIS